MKELELLEGLQDLQKQATTERSHYYVNRMIGRAIAELVWLRLLVVLADDIRAAQRAYMADRGNEEKGRAVGAAAAAYDEARGQ